jgi:hypothetical protein
LVNVILWLEPDLEALPGEILRYSHQIMGNGRSSNWHHSTFGLLHGWRLTMAT